MSQTAVIMSKLECTKANLDCAYVALHRAWRENLDNLSF